MIKKYHVSKQLFDKDNTEVHNAYFAANGDWIASSDSRCVLIPVTPNTQYTLSVGNSLPVFRIYETSLNNPQYNNQFKEIIRDTNISSYTFTTRSSAKYIGFQGSASFVNDWLNSLMLNTGSTALPYEPYGNTWNSIPYRKRETATDTITTLPKQIIGDGQSASAVIKGNMQQTGTPTPTSPIYPSETGNKTANLYNESTIQNGYYSGVSGSNPSTFTADNRYRAFTAFLTAGTYTIKISADETIRLLRCSNDIDGVVDVQTDNAPYTFTLTGDTNIYVSFRNSTTTNSFTNLKIMLNTGSTAKTYEPYGYKIPILSGGTTTPVYLGEVETTRKIQKLILTGQETWLYSSGFFYNQNISPDYLRTSNRIVYCTHYQGINSVTAGGQVGNGECSFYSSPGVQRLYICDDNYSTTDAFKAYLQQQYTNGTPVTVWYVLATPQTTTLNEPIRKIGNYADSVSATNIPTTGTAESFDVDTDLKPSEVSLTYHGWHEHEPKEYSGGSWT